MSQNLNTSDTAYPFMEKKNLIKKNLIGSTQRSVRINKNLTENKQKKMSQNSTTMSSDTGAKKNLMQKNLIGLHQRSVKVNPTENQQKKMSSTQNLTMNSTLVADMAQLPKLTKSGKRMNVVIKKKKRKKNKKLNIKKKARKIEVDFQEEKVDINTNQETKEEMPRQTSSMKQARVMGLQLKGAIKLQKWFRNELCRQIVQVEEQPIVAALYDPEDIADLPIAVAQVIDAACNEFKSGEENVEAIEEQLLEDLNSLANLENPEEGETKEAPSKKVKKKRVISQFKFLTRNRCLANVWDEGTSFKQCTACCSDDGSGLCKTHVKNCSKIVKKPHVGRFFIEKKSDVHGLFGENWSCIPVVTLQDGTDFVAVNHPFYMNESLGNDPSFVPWMQGAKSEEDKEYLKKNKKIFRRRIKDHRQMIVNFIDHQNAEDEEFNEEFNEDQDLFSEYFPEDEE